MTRSAKKRHRDERRKAERELKHRGILDNDNRSATGLQTRRRPVFRRASVFLVALLSLATAHGAAWVTGTITDPNTATANESLVFYPLSTPQTDGSILIRTGTIALTATNGVFEVELEQGDYRVTINNRDKFLIAVPNDNSTNVINDLITTALTYTYAAVPSTTADPDAVHDNVAGEINALTEKASPADEDLVIIEDSAAGWAKKKVQIANIGGGGGGGGSGDEVQVEDGNELGTFSAVDTTARFSDAGDINFSLLDGGSGGPDEIYASIRPSSVGATEIATGSIGTGHIADGELVALGGLTSAADKLPYFDGVDSAALADFTTFGRSLVADANAAAGRTTLGLVIGTDVQAYSAILAATTASFTTADETKLDGVETGADVTDAANVEAAGALMDSEVDADLKTLSLPAGTTISAFGATLVDDPSASAGRSTLGLVIGTDVEAADADIAKVNEAETITGNWTHQGQVNMTDATVIAAGSAMASTNVDWTVTRNTRTLTGDTAFDLDAAGAPSAGGHTKLVITGDGSVRTITFDQALKDLSNDEALSAGDPILVQPNANLELQLIYDAGGYRVVGLPGMLHNFAGTAAPGVGDDEDDGYEVGSVWVDVTNDNSYICQDATAGAAVWAQTDATGGGTDADAIHDNVAGEIAALTAATVASGDLILIEDVDDANSKKRVTAGDIAGLAGSGGAFSDAADPVLLNSTGKDVAIGAAQKDSAKFTVDGDADQPQVVIEGHSTQTNPLIRAKSSLGNVLLELDNSGNLNVKNAIDFEGTENAFETRLAATDATADRTITLPNVSGVVPVPPNYGSAGQVLTTDGSTVSWGGSVTNYLEYACSDETTDLTTGVKITDRAPFAFTVTEVRASLTTAPAGLDFIADIHLGGTSIMTTDKILIDAGETTSTSAATLPTLTTTSFANDQEFTIEIDQVGTTTKGAGLKVRIYYKL